MPNKSTVPKPTRHPLIWDDIAICRDHGVKCQIDMAVEEVLRSLREEIAGMPWTDTTPRWGDEITLDSILSAIDRRLEP